MAKVLILAGLSALLGCAGASPIPSGRGDGVPLPAPRKGQYCWSQGGRLLGIERYTVGSGPGSWWAEGEQSWSGGAHVVQRYRIEAERSDGRPRALFLEVEVAGERRRLRGRRQGAYLELEAEGAGGASTRRVAWGRDTWIGFPSPLFWALGLARGRTEERRGDRVVLFQPPELSPVVRWAEIEARGQDAQGQRFLIHPGEGLPPIGVWLAPDGLPTRLRQADPGAPVLEAVETASCSAPRG